MNVLKVSAVQLHIRILNQLPFMSIPLKLQHAGASDRQLDGRRLVENAQVQICP